MSVFCDAGKSSNPNYLTAGSNTSTTAMYIPVKSTDDDVKNHFMSQLAQAPSFDNDTFEFLLEDIIPNLFMYQTEENAKQGSTSQAYHRLSNNIHADNNVLSRRDVNDSEPNNLPLCLKEDGPKIRKFINAIMQYLKDDLGMLPEHEKIVRVYALKWQKGSGMGMHSDYTSASDDVLFFMRLIFGIGGSRKIKFTAYSFDENTLGGWQGRNVAKVDKHIHTLTTKDPADAYLTSSFANGKMPLCWKNDGKRNGIVMKHEVERVKSTDDEAINFIVDFPLASIGKVMRALATVEGRVFDLSKYL